MERRNAMKKLKLFTILMSIALSHLWSFGQSPPIDQSRMGRDLRIMEGILNRLLQDESEDLYSRCKIDGFYLPQYGIIFHTCQPRPAENVAIFDMAKDMAILKNKADRQRKTISRIRTKGTGKDEIILEIRAELDSVKKEAESQAEAAEKNVHKMTYVKTFDEYRRDKIQKEEVRLKDLKDELFVFFNDYARAIGQLQKNDRIAVIINLDGWELTNQNLAFLSGWISKAQIERNEDESIKNKIENNIRFLVSSRDSAVSKDIQIMTEIMDSGIQLTQFKGSSASQGMYLDGLGAIIFLNIPMIHFLDCSDSSSFQFIFQNKVEKAIAYSYGAPCETDSKKLEINLKEKISKIKEELSELMISYGHTLRLKPEEYIVVKADLGSQYVFWNDENMKPTTIILQLQKKLLDRYNAGTLTKSDLKQKMISHIY